ncbi:multidrug effflux MFS transporter [Ferrimonas balearica]|uniref:multidrug effflux MFS transporter n=1 Tax=Ferrimonas balearica TaxID=44012 RepID=UPI001C597B8E|nr:multidrug effflux MFS transporter [Ferrimonas balearica]MBW3139811.1 multidrug effflux MFS transporter [Ferrimonas balearica]MBW3164833.1 multidrug effflux MFS transporter [Ferrimonas balearica]MBY6107083.1 multidrug effflux MFS transporter [Ferrimonas balearica]
MTRPVPFVLLMLLVAFSPLAIDIFLPAVPAMADALAAPLPQVQATVAVFLLAMGLGQLLAGPLADRYGRRPLALSGVALYLAGSLMAAWANQIEVLWLARLLQGFGACAVVVAAMSGVRDSYGPERAGPIYSYLNGVICVVPALAPLLGGMLAALWDWRATFYFMAVYALLAGALVAWRLPETRPADTRSEGALVSWARYQPVVSHPVFQYHAGFIMLAMAVIIGYVSLAPVQLMVAMKQSPMAFSLWFGANAAINIAAAFAAPSIVARVGKRAALRLAIGLCLVAAIALLLLADLSHPAAFMGPVFISSIGFCFVFAVCGGSALAPFGERAGTASALLGLFQMTGASVLVGLVNLLPVAPVASLAVLMLLPLVWLGLARLNRAGHQQVQAAMVSVSDNAPAN